MRRCDRWSLLHRARQAGYTGGKSALYALVQTIRPHRVTPLVRFDGLAGEVSQHDFGEVWVTYQDGTEMKVHVFASRLKYSRWVEGRLVPNERVEPLVRTLVDHLAAFGGMPTYAHPAVRPSMRLATYVRHRRRQHSLSSSTNATVGTADDIYDEQKPQGLGPRAPR